MPGSQQIAQPIVTVVLYALNEEFYIGEAIKSLLSQTYSPLEIVLSDDGSQDRTFEIMQQAAAAYEGPHRIILNRNKNNFGIGSQLNAAVEMSTGELIVLANGDDVSLPERVETLVTHWRASDKRVSVITSDLLVIGPDGRASGRIINTETFFKNLEDGVLKRFGGVAAASLAVRRDVFGAFGPLPANLILEDNPLYLRAVLLGERLHLKDQLVKYRVHPENISQAYDLAAFETWRARHRRNSVWQKNEAVKAYLQMLRDMHAAPADNWPEEDLKRARWAGMEKLMENSMLRDFYSNDQTVPSIVRLASFVRLAILLVKLVVKKALPIIDERNDRWHYRRVKSVNE